MARAACGLGRIMRCLDQPRAHTTQGERTMYQGTKVVDVHGHMTTPAKFRGFAMNLMTLRSPHNRFEMSDEELDRALGPHIEALDTRNIDFQLLSPRPVAMFQWESPHIQRQWATVTNDV